MSKLLKSDLSSINSNGVIQKLDTYSSDINTLSSSITSFISGSAGSLEGDAADAIRSKLGVYSDCLKNVSTICINLKSNILAANNTMINYMEEFDELDDADKNEVKAALKEAETYLSNLQAKQREYNALLADDENGFYASKVAQIQGGIDKFDALTKKMKKLSEKLDEFVGRANSVNSQYLSSVTTDITKMTSFVGGISTSTFTVNSLNSIPKKSTTTSGTGTSSNKDSSTSTEATVPASGQTGVVTDATAPASEESAKESEKSVDNKETEMPKEDKEEEKPKPQIDPGHLVSI